MSGDEVFVLVIASVISFFIVIGYFWSSKNRLYVRRSTGEGLVRLAVLGSMAWVVYVLYHYADPSVVGVYRLFYILLGFAVIHLFGLGGAGRTGMRYKVDVHERDNPAAGLLVAAFVLATGMIYGCSLWGEADPDGEGEGGWWIPMGFFLAGWIALLMATRLYRVRETGGVVRRMRQIRQPGQTVGFALYILSSGWILADSVAGDFYGWLQGLAAVGAIGGMLIGHELVGLTFKRDLNAKPKAMTGMEVLIYLGMTVGFAMVNRILLPKWGIPL
ncbi:MAG TPA: hypothetical protein PKE26_07750 [Kiritimatiellia bacterium]|nr:hypothetical protein [Kiritimatiellia bacterium]HMO98985.1 hypothetical protein [Kiritimatiellia bacterium]HMP96696.1 hypothetical protein [Kiritimatiellia bacterium]